MSLPFPVHIPFAESLGLELLSMADGQATIRLVLTEPHLNTWCVAHGGVVMTLLDVAMAHAARSAHDEPPGQGPGVATVEMKTTFMQPGTGELRAHGKVLHRTPGMVFCEASVVDAHEALCAHATGTFKYLRALPTRDRTLRPQQRHPGAVPPATV
jgi:uncharacterized protein (TIGR00369 family)